MFRAQGTAQTRHRGGNQPGGAEGRPERGDVSRSRSANWAGARPCREGSALPLRPVESHWRLLSRGLSGADLCVKMLSKQIVSVAFCHGCGAGPAARLSGPAPGPTSGPAHCGQGGHLEELVPGFSGPSPQGAIWPGQPWTAAT